MKVNKHGLKMVGLKKAAGETKSLNPYDNGYVQISYDKRDGEVLADYHYAIGCNEWSVYRSNEIISIRCFHSPATMQEIADAIANFLEEI